MVNNTAVALSLKNLVCKDILHRSLLISPQKVSHRLCAFPKSCRIDYITILKRHCPAFICQRTFNHRKISYLLSILTDMALGTAGGIYLSVF